MHIELSPQGVVKAVAIYNSPVLGGVIGVVCLGAELKSFDTSHKLFNCNRESESKNGNTPIQGVTGCIPAPANNNQQPAISKHMRIHLKTAVQQDYITVFNAFDERLFRKLSPPYPRLKLLRFDGSEPGDVVAVALQTGFKSFRWTSLITERKVTDTEAYFVDQGQELPPPLRFWRHQHLITKNGSGAIVHDIITYSTGIKPLDLLLYPLMVAQFSMRKPVYKREFGKAE